VIKVTENSSFENLDTQQATVDEMRAIAKNLIDNVPENDLCEMLVSLKAISECTIEGLYKVEIRRLKDTTGEYLDNRGASCIIQV
jgi:hypothetical protein